MYVPVTRSLQSQIPTVLIERGIPYAQIPFAPSIEFPESCFKRHNIIISEEVCVFSFRY